MPRFRTPTTEHKTDAVHVSILGHRSTKTGATNAVSSVIHHCGQLAVTQHVNVMQV